MHHPRSQSSAAWTPRNRLWVVGIAPLGKESPWKLIRTSAHHWQMRLDMRYVTILAPQYPCDCMKRHDVCWRITVTFSAMCSRLNGDDMWAELCRPLQCSSGVGEEPQAVHLIKGDKRFLPIRSKHRMTQIKYKMIQLKLLSFYDMDSSEPLELPLSQHSCWCYPHQGRSVVTPSFSKDQPSAFILQLKVVYLAPAIAR